MDLLTKELDI